MTCGIYLLRFNGTHKVYVGQSINIEDRYGEHKSLISRGESSILLNKAYLDFGTPYLEILCECSKEDLDRYEEEAIAIFNSCLDGFNSVAKISGTGTRVRKSGENAPMCNYTNDQILGAFFLLLDNKLSQEDIAIKLGISKNVIKDISCGNSHVWISNIYPEDYMKLVKLKNNRNTSETNTYVYSKDQIEAIFKAIISNPESTSDTLASMLSINVNTIKSIRNGINHKWLEKVYPEDYATMISAKGSRLSLGKTAKDKGICYPEIISPEGIRYRVDNIRAFAREHNLNQGHLGAVLRGKEQHHKGWKLDDHRI